MYSSSKCPFLSRDWPRRTLLEAAAQALDELSNHDSPQRHALSVPASNVPRPSGLRSADDQFRRHPSCVDPVFAIRLADRVELVLERLPAIFQHEILRVRDADRVGVSAGEGAWERLAKSRREDEQARVVDDVRVGQVAACLEAREQIHLRWRLLRLGYGRGKG